MAKMLRKPVSTATLWEHHLEGDDADKAREKMLDNLCKADLFAGSGFSTLLFPPPRPGAQGDSVGAMIEKMAAMEPSRKLRRVDFTPGTDQLQEILIEGIGAATLGRFRQYLDVSRLGVIPIVGFAGSGRPMPSAPPLTSPASSPIADGMANLLNPLSSTRREPCTKPTPFWSGAGGAALVYWPVTRGSCRRRSCHITRSDTVAASTCSRTRAESRYSRSSAGAAGRASSLAAEEEVEEDVVEEDAVQEDVVVVVVVVVVAHVVVVGGCRGRRGGGNLSW
ncbi:uncharacterized protein B0T15DRAFT_520218 [Chaetomium strumarium]|uniref:Uncharacterized protein n=1 Tax=Chaetomium strumarium TaxID=1170767 RepID=A0AAJ0H3U1_9PEZI|nr:hypothetical protein B0T15DRAFT_520218 [Chaetomium strumarium]